MKPESALRGLIASPGTTKWAAEDDQRGCGHRGPPQTPTFHVGFVATAQQAKAGTAELAAPNERSSAAMSAPVGRRCQQAEPA